jgi:hypothetical protein
MPLWRLAERSAIILIEDVRMGEVVRLEEIDRERRRSRARVAERAHLERAIALL